MDDESGIGDALQYFGADDYPMPTSIQAYLGSGDQEGDYPMPTTSQAYLGSGDQEGDYPMPTNAQTPGAFGSSAWEKLLKGNFGGAGKDFLTSKGGIAALMALLAYLDRQKAAPQGGGTTQAYAGPAKPYTPRTEQGKYGPIMRYAADGGLMHAYANGGEAQAYAGGKPLMMEDGGFVFTEEATRELEPRGIAALGGKMITAPGNGTNDKGITGIIGKNGVTPARVSDGESYFPRHAVENQGGPQRMYALMNNLQRSA